jgi:hypothetical protein
MPSIGAPLTLDDAGYVVPVVRLIDIKRANTVRP